MKRWASKCHVNGDSWVGTKSLQSSLTDRFKGSASPVISVALRRMCFCKTVLGGSKCDFNIEKVIHSKTAHEEFEYNRFMRRESWKQHYF